MASIQQSMNAMTASIAGALTAGSYMVRQSDAFKAHQADKSAEKMAKTLPKNEEDYKNMTVAQRDQVDRTTEAIIAQREKSAHLHPTEKRTDSLYRSKEGQQKLKNYRANLQDKELEEQVIADQQMANADAYEEGRLQVDEEGNVYEVNETFRERTPEPAREPTREELEQQRADQAVRDMILQDERLVAVGNRTTEYQNYLYGLRGGIV